MSAFGWVMLVVGVFILGQFLMLRPQPGEKRLMAMRAKARELGLQVYLRKIPSWLPPPEGRQIISHYLLLRDDGAGVLSGRYWRARDGEWVAEGGFRQCPPPEPVWSQWKNDILGVETTANAVIVYWLEQGGQDRLPELLRLMQEVMDKLLIKTNA